MSRSYQELLNGGVRKRRFFDRISAPEEWETTYRSCYLAPTHRPPPKINDKYQSPYRQQSAPSLQVQQEKRRRRCATLGQPFLVSEPIIRGLSNLCPTCAAGEIQKLPSRRREWVQEDHDPGVHCCLECGQEIPDRRLVLTGVDVALLGGSPAGRNDWTKLRVYTKAMPTVQRQPLPGDISEPKIVQLQARDWKGVAYPFVDPLFDPLFPVSLDASIAPTTLDPFKYCQRRRAFPQFSRSSNLPVPGEAWSVPEPPGKTTIESKLYNRRWARRRFPRPPELFVTRLW